MFNTKPSTEDITNFPILFHVFGAASVLKCWLDSFSSLL